MGRSAATSFGAGLRWEEWPNESVKRNPVASDPAALAEGNAAAAWYKNRSLQAAEEFLREFERAVECIAVNDYQCPVFAFGTRRVVFRKFPYSPIFSRGR